MILDLGCGTAKVRGAIGVDIIPLAGVDVISDLRIFPYPFADNTFDEIYLNDIIEHIPDTIGVMEEVFRISKPNGRIFIRVVNWNSHYTAMDPTHVKAFTEHSFDFFGKREIRSYYTHARFNVVNVEYQFNCDAEKLLRSKRLLKFLSNYLCNILEGLNFELQTRKKIDINKINTKSETHNLVDILRCPYCLTKNNKNKDYGKLQLHNRRLICRTPDCSKKFRYNSGKPVLRV